MSTQDHKQDRTQDRTPGEPQGQAQGEPQGQPQGQWPGPSPAAERKADEVRENLMGGAPRTSVTATDRAAVPDRASDGGEAPPAPEQASAERADRADRAPDTELLESAHTEEFRRRWDAIKAAFVDDPRDAVRRAGELTDEVVEEFTAVVEARRRELATEHSPAEAQGKDKEETERLRVALNGYRGLLGPILHL